ncbi:MAG: enoyl-CoA hydratase/isomerase family protein [Myxococcota bacterium]|nr:enoyl-CoA hydratase/isomerase family protein [Myxococcota bacterium]
MITTGETMIEERIEDNIVIATLNDGRTNAFTLETLTQIDDLVKRVNEDDALKGIVLTGNGRFFSSGFHLPMFLGFKDHAEAVDFFLKEEEILINFFTCKKPVVSAINGHCAAAGLIFSMAADYRIAKFHEKIKIGMSEIKIGLSLSIAQNEIVRFGLNSDKAYRDVMYFGEMMGVHKAKEMEIIDEVVNDDEALISRAKEIVGLWIDTPNRPFITMKGLLKQDTVERIHKGLADETWKDALHCFFREDVRATLQFVQASMNG